MLATAVSGEDDLGPEVNTKIQSLTLAPGGDHLSPSQLTDVARLQKEFADVFLPLPGRTNLIQHHIETEPGVVVRSRPYRLPEHKKTPGRRGQPARAPLLFPVPPVGVRY